MTIPAKGVPANEIPVRKREAEAAPAVEAVVEAQEEKPKKAAAKKKLFSKE